jgi:hypothetical protein
MAASGIELGLRHRWSYGPKPAWPVQPVGDRRAFQAGDGTQYNFRKERGAGNADLLVRCRHPALGRRDVGVPF